MLSNLLSSINENLYDWLDDLVFINESIIEQAIPIIGVDAFSGIHLLCNSLIYGFLLYYAISYFFSHLTFSQIERPVQFIFKLLLCAIALNASQYLCSALISIFSKVSEIIIEIGEVRFPLKDISFASLVEHVLPSEYFTSNSFSLFSFDGIVKTTITFGFLSLSISYAIRYILIIALSIISPFAILSLATSKSSSFFKSWLKCLISLLFLQVFISVLLIVCFILNDKNFSFSSTILHLGMIYSLFKANSFVRDIIGGFSTDVNLSFSNLSSILKGGSLK